MHSISADVGLVASEVRNSQETAELAYDLDVVGPSVLAELGTQCLGGWRLRADIISVGDARGEREQNQPAGRCGLRHRVLLV
jgi:hypothetical protein